MKLQEVGFYTLTDERVLQASQSSNLQRCELILTDRCNFKCPYCRGIRDDCSGTIPLEQAKQCLSIWIKNNLKNIRFSGGEPTLYKGLPELVRICADNGVERIAISTNGAASKQKYQTLLNAGVNDFSISLDACCSAMGDKMAGGISGIFNKIVENIKFLASKTYVTVGVVFTEDNITQSIETVEFADSLGVSDIRIISSAQYNQGLVKLQQLKRPLLQKYPILKYRVAKENNKKTTIRGITSNDSHQCPLALDDMAVAGGEHGLYHFPCIIYLREGGEPIGKLSDNVRIQRYQWVKQHNSACDNICRTNCLDVCRDYNNRFQEFRGKV